MGHVCKRCDDTQKCERFRAVQIPALAVARFLQSALVGRPAAGQEPVAAAICAHLRSEDAISAAHRPHLLAIAQVVASRPMTAEIFGRQTGFGR